MRQLGVIRDKQVFSAAEVAREEYFFCGPSPGMFLFIPCLSRMTSKISHGSLRTARFRTRLFKDFIVCHHDLSFHFSLFFFFLGGGGGGGPALFFILPRFNTYG